MKRKLIVYAKRPLPGIAKTRLGASIGLEEAAGVYARLLYQYLMELLHADFPDTEIELSLASPADVPFFKAAFPEWTVQAQVEGDIGERMAASFAQAFSSGAERVVLTGSDIPSLNPALVEAAFEALEDAPIALGPAADGGYYLIGMRAPGADLFAGVQWSTMQVLAQTTGLAHAQGLEIACVAVCSDLDTVTDYQRWQRRLLSSGPGLVC